MLISGKKNLTNTKSHKDAKDNLVRGSSGISIVFFIPRTKEPTTNMSTTISSPTKPRGNTILAEIITNVILKTNFSVR